MRTTSAPKSASIRTHVGPALTLERSRTRKRERAFEAVIFATLIFLEWNI